VTLYFDFTGMLLMRIRKC